MDGEGLVVNARAAWPDDEELVALGVEWLRTIVYDFDEFERALDSLTVPVKVIALLNQETAGIGDDLSGWNDVVIEFGRRFGQKVAAVECLNEWDLLGLSPEQAVECAVSASLLLPQIQVLLGSVASEHWIASLERASFLLSQREHQVAGVCLHPYGQRADGFPSDWGFGEISEAVRFAHAVSGLPVWLTEFGIKLADAGGLVGQARYLQKAFTVLKALDSGVLAVACYFCWRDDVGAPHEQGDQAFGLRDRDGKPRGAWHFYAFVAEGTGEPGCDRPAGGGCAESRCRTGRDVFAAGNLPASIVNFDPESPAQSHYRPGRILGGDEAGEDPFVEALRRHPSSVVEGERDSVTVAKSPTDRSTPGKDLCDVQAADEADPLPPKTILTAIFVLGIVALIVVLALI